MAASSSGETWIAPGGGRGGKTPPVPPPPTGPSSRIAFWNASGYWEIT